MTIVLKVWFCNSLYKIIVSVPIVKFWMPQNRTNNKLTLVQAMAWCCQATSHYLSWCWPRFMSPYGITRPPVNDACPISLHKTDKLTQWIIHICTKFTCALELWVACGWRFKKFSPSVSFTNYTDGDIWCHLACASESKFHLVSSGQSKANHGCFVEPMASNAHQWQWVHYDIHKRPIYTAIQTSTAFERKFSVTWYVNHFMRTE